MKEMTDRTGKCPKCGGKLDEIVTDWFFCDNCDGSFNEDDLNAEDVKLEEKGSQ